MMMKYRVHEVAKDLNIPNKDVIDTLEKYTGETKKHMTALDENELDLVFETFTQKNSSENLDVYFAQANRNETVVEPEKPDVIIQPEQPAARPAVQQVSAPRPAQAAQQPQRAPAQPSHAAPGVPAADQKPVRKAVKPGKITPVGPKPTPPKAPAAPRPQQQPVQRRPLPVNTDPNAAIKRTEGRIVDTRTSHVELDKYNEKYDRLASEKINTANTVQKQKLTQRSTQYRGKPRNSRKETESERLRRIALERKAKPITIQIPEEITVGELALRLKATAAEVIKKLMVLGVFAAVNDTIDFDTATLVAMEFHAKVEKEVVVTIEEQIIDDSEDKDDNLVPRAPVVVVMGHVDHGKTSLLDAIRHANVTASEAGGITQHIGAYQVRLEDREVTFLDTPGHAAFTTMRARGAQVTDIAILVVAADDGIMPQTIEAIHHAKAANVSIIVAINKMDKPGANPQHVMEQLTEYELVPEEWGGDTPCIPVSAVTKAGIKDLLEMIILTADIKELKANPDRAAKGTVIEARLDKGRGPIATMLVQNGTLRTGDIIVAGTTVGRVRAMTNADGQKIEQAGPSVPVEITGLDDVPTGGDIFNAVSDERLARELVEQRRTEMKEERFNSRTKVTLDNLFDQMKQGDMKELQIIVKADVQGSVEAVRQSLEKLSDEEVRVNVIHGGVGAISESDVMLASASNAIIVGFNVRPDPVAEENAKRDGVDMRLYRIIYDCIGEIESAMKGMLAPKFREVALGKAECREVYKITNVGTIVGSHVTTGKITRAAQIRVVRDGIVITEDKIASLRRFKDDVKEVAEGYDCGIGLERFSDIKEGDILEAFVMEEYRE
ncbi:translation initiation factor IF-2 [Caproiciproducens faecalis]|uniref:Translation initiation factor IF-2 n=1 Tax=Caproiciproducens faecalis TaxID=2820301 RepID=A0ABS7DP76_9FIRM|nr:translation initiation factor IF-2 [Caproiciproducens faecalis]MBW7572867.1 translation initiation factor IF-2 [Caproiciproducens faecalis]